MTLVWLNKVMMKKKETNIETDNKVGRNSSCPCGSGKKYKKCHG